MLTIYESRRAWLEQKLRLHLPKEAYDVFLHIFEDKTKIAEPLEALGVIRVERAANQGFQPYIER